MPPQLRHRTHDEAAFRLVRAVGVVNPDYRVSDLLVLIGAVDRPKVRKGKYQARVDWDAREDVTILTEAEITAIEANHRIRRAVL